MPRKGPAARRELLPDPIYNSLLVTQIQNRIMTRGKRTLAEAIVYDALRKVQDKTGKDPLPLLKKAVDNIRPLLEVMGTLVLHVGEIGQGPFERHPERAPLHRDRSAGEREELIRAGPEILG